MRVTVVLFLLDLKKNSVLMVNFKVFITLNVYSKYEQMELGAFGSEIVIDSFYSRQKKCCL